VAAPVDGGQRRELALSEVRLRRVEAAGARLRREPVEEARDCGGVAVPERLDPDPAELR
jgi:hypothetical protein